MPKENRLCGQAGWGVQQDRRTGTNGRKRDDMLPASERALRVQQSATRAKHQKRQDRGEKLPARLGCESLLNMVRHLSVLALVGSFNHILVQGLTKTGLTAEAASGPRASSGASAAGRPGSSERNVSGGPTLVSRDCDDGVSDDGVSGRCYSSLTTFGSAFHATRHAVFSYTPVSRLSSRRSAT